MAYPNFSEFTFGYAVTKALEELYGKPNVAPVFPTTCEEGKKDNDEAGYDVKFETNYVPLFIQYKRSEIIKSPSCKEMSDKGVSDLSRPFFRMNLHRSKYGDYNQHFALTKIEEDGNDVFYCTSSYFDKSEIDAYYANNKILEHSDFFSPSEIELPDDIEKHFVSYNREKDYAWLFSDTSKRIERNYPTFEALKNKIDKKLSSNFEETLRAMETSIKLLNEVGFEKMGDDRRNLSLKSSESEDDLRLIYVTLPTILMIPEENRPNSFKDFKQIKNPLKRLATELFYNADVFTIQIAKSEQYK